MTWNRTEKEKSEKVRELEEMASERDRGKVALKFIEVITVIV